MAVRALRPHYEVNYHRPDPDDPDCFFQFRRITYAIERRIAQQHTHNGVVDQEASTNEHVAWSLTGWGRFCEPYDFSADREDEDASDDESQAELLGPEIPYDFKFDFDQESAEEKARKLKVVSAIPDNIKGDLLFLMKARLVRVHNEIKNWRRGWHAGNKSDGGKRGGKIETAARDNGSGFPSPAPVVEPRATSITEPSPVR